jgi:hypothetical protein
MPYESFLEERYVKNYKRIKKSHKFSVYKGGLVGVVEKPVNGNVKEKINDFVLKVVADYGQESVLSMALDFTKKSIAKQRVLKLKNVQA